MFWKSSTISEEVSLSSSWPLFRLSAFAGSTVRFFIFFNFFNFFKFLNFFKFFFFFDFFKFFNFFQFFFNFFSIFCFFHFFHFFSFFHQLYHKNLKNNCVLFSRVEPFCQRHRVHAQHQIGSLLEADMGLHNSSHSIVHFYLFFSFVFASERRRLLLPASGHK